MTERSTKMKRFCKTCKYFNWLAFPGKKETCLKLGSLETTKACETYAPNPFVLEDVEELLLPLSHVMVKLPSTVLPLLVDIIANEKFNRQKGFHFLEKVAVKYRGGAGDNYISNYLIARVYTSTDDGIFIISKNGSRMFMMPCSVMKFDKFEELRKRLKAEGKLVDPKVPKPTVKQKHGIPETMDEVRKGVLPANLDRKVRRMLLSKNLEDRVERELGKKHKSSLKKRYKEQLTEFKVSRETRTDKPEEVVEERKTISKQIVKKPETTARKGEQIHNVVVAPRLETGKTKKRDKKKKHKKVEIKPSSDILALVKSVRKPAKVKQPNTKAKDALSKLKKQARGAK